MYKTEKQLTTKQNKVIYEEVYFNADMSPSNYNNNGYLLTYPNKFSQNPSQDKSIGIRRIKVVPPMHSFTVAVEYDDGISKHKTDDFLCEYQSQNTFQEILVDLIPKFELNKDGVTYYMKYNYDKDKGELILESFKIGNVPEGNENEDGQGNIGEEVTFRFVCSNYSGYLSLWSLLNQFDEIPFNGLCNDDSYNEDSMIFFSNILFVNVWNRTPLYLHASFSDSKYHYVCMTDDYWEKPSKLFFDNVHGLEFTIYFTTDGVNKIVPYWANKLLELSFILRTNLM